jgi:hypothetical protein
MKKDTEKWCNFHKRPWHKNIDFHSKKSLVVEVKSSESNVGFYFDSKLEKGRHIINAELSATVATTKIHPDEPDEPEEGDHLFHSDMWVK